MVDAAHAFESKAKPISKSDRVMSSTVQVTVSPATESALSAYRTLAGDGLCAPAQGSAWTDQWVESVKPDALIAVMAKDGEAVLALALEIVRQGPCLVARFMSGTHANGNFALARRSFLAKATPADINALIGAIPKARPDVDIVALERLLPSLDGIANPLLALPHFNSANVSLAVDLTGGFDALLARSNGKRKRKKYRSQSRKLEAAGGYRRIEAGTQAEVERLLEGFFAMKDIRFRKAGIHNVFGEPEVKDFFRHLFSSALSVSPRPFVLHGLEVGGRLRAITGSSRRGDTLICEFGAIVEDEIAHASPGDFLFFENIREACADKLAVYDFSVGDELYKRLWCDLETRHVDAIVPLTIKGSLMAGGLRLYARLKASIKNSPLIWKITKAMRRRAVGENASAAAEASGD